MQWEEDFADLVDNHTTTILLPVVLLFDVAWGSTKIYGRGLASNSNSQLLKNASHQP
jgi:hypothetical protein